jgi:hypothetical protein
MEKPLPQKLLVYFKTLPQKIYTFPELGQLIADFAKAVRYPFSVDPEEYVQYLVNQGKITKIVLSGPQSSAIRLLTRECNRYEIGLSIKSRSYFSHGTAAYLQGLTNTEPVTLHLSAEGVLRESNHTELRQSAIDQAFAKPQRQSANRYTWESQEFMLLTSLFTQGKGIEKRQSYGVTGPERTLLDVTVRPSYAGGADEVLNLYKRAAQTVMDPKKLLELYDSIAFIYPYHQAIGFYLERAGYSGGIIKALQKRPRPNTFYLDYAIKQKAFDTFWNLYYPAALDH